MNELIGIDESDENAATKSTKQNLLFTGSSLRCLDVFVFAGTAVEVSTKKVSCTDKPGTYIGNDATWRPAWNEAERQGVRGENCSMSRGVSYQNYAENPHTPAEEA